MGDIPSSSVDYIFTDPPYGSRVQFWESNQVWEAWLGLNTKWDEDELIVNRIRGLDEDHWRNIFRKSMAECRRALKPGRWITLTYNDRETWPILQDVMLELGFIPDGADSPIAMETTAKSEKQMKGEDNTRRDLVVNFRKPRVGEALAEDSTITGKEDERTFLEKVSLILKDSLLDNPGMTSESLLEILISHMVRRGELEHLKFKTMLASVAEESPPGSDRWYLRDQEAEKIDLSESRREEAAASILEGIIEKRLEKSPHLSGIMFAEL